RFEISKKRMVEYQHDERDSRSISNDLVRCGLQDHSGRMWIGTSGGGLNLFDPSSGGFTNFRHDPRQSNSLSNNNVLSLYEDNQRLYWVGTREGLCRFVDPVEQFTVYQNNPSDKSTLSNDFLYSLYEDRSGILWVATDGGGLNRYDPQSKKFTAYLHDPQNPSSLRNNYVRTIYEDRAGNLWVGNTRGYLHMFDRKSGTSRVIELPRREGQDSDIRAMVETSDGTFWVGSNDGLFVVDRSRWKYRRPNIGLRGEDSSFASRIYALCESPDGRVWIGAGSNGLIVYDPRVHRSIVHRFDPTNPKGLSNRHVTTHIGLGRNGRVWVTAGVGGLLRFEGDESGLTCVIKDVGLPDNMVYGFLEDASGQLWLSTDHGLYKYDPGTGKIRTFGIRQGLPATGFNSRSFCKTRRGEVFIGSTNGMFSFYPDSIPDNTRIPPVFITKLRVHEREVSRDSSLSFLTQTTLPWHDNFLSFEFAALDFRDAAENSYEYMLEGLEQSWVPAGTRRYASYTNLDPGTYVFRVRAANNHEVWNLEGARLAVAIERPWWSMWWAISLYAIAVSGVLLVFHRGRLQRIRLAQQVQIEHLQAEKLAELDQLKSRFFANLSHEFRTPLSLILGPADQLETSERESGRRKQLGVIRRNAERLLRMVNLLLQFARIESGTLKLQVSLQPIPRLLRRIGSSFSTAAVKKGIALHADIEPASFEGYIDAEKVEHVLENLLSNALKYTSSGGRVDIRARRLGTELVLEVSDTGLGISPEHLSHVFERFYRVDSSHQYEGTGIGLSLSKEFVDLHHGTIELKSSVGVGTVATVRLSLSGYQEHEIVKADASRREERPGISEHVRVSEEIPGTENVDKTVVLVAEDNDDAREYLRSRLYPEFDVVEVVNGVQAWETASQRIPDVVVSDVMMPEMNGYELCAKLKQDERTSHIPVILLTALADQTDKIEGLQTGADDYLVKPFDAQELLVRIRNLIASRKKIQDRFRTSVPLKPGEVKVESLEDRFLVKVMSVVESHISEEQFDVEQFAEGAHLSRGQLHRKLKALTNLSPTDFIRYIRLRRAKELLEKQAGTVSEVAYRVGFSNHSYFAKCFKEQFGCLPSEIGLSIR
ncbi:MAG: response regulator, partial [Bacteroidetes bacterium]|nr:response regulator [Bacteroidota bacterium]